LINDRKSISIIIANQSFTIKKKNRKII